MIIKKQTGRKFTPEAFRKLDKCNNCGKAGIWIQERCDECTSLVFRECAICDFALRTEQQKFYAYDNRAVHRDNRDVFLLSKELIWEFSSTDEPKYPAVSESLCSGCVGWQERMKDICWMCDNDFENDLFNYKLNGNMCEFCSTLFEKNYASKNNSYQEKMEG